MGFYDSFVLTFVDAIIILLLVHNILPKFKTKFVNKVIFIVVTSMSISLFTLFIENKIISHIICAVDMFIILVIYLRINGSKNFVSNILIYFVNTILIIVVQLMVVLSINVFVGSIEYSFSSGIIAQLMALSIVIIITRYVPLSYIDILIKDNNISFRIIITSIFILYYSITILWLLVNNNLELILFGVMVLLIFAITLVTFILREGYLSSVYQEKLLSQETYFPIIDDMIEELRNQQHDYHNQIQTILSMKRDTSISDEDIENYVTNIKKRGYSSKLVGLDNRIIGAFLYSKVNEAENKGKIINIDINYFSFDSIYETYQIIEMYGILIDNAIEGVNSCDEYKNIDIFLSNKNGTYIFEIKNDYKYISVSEISRFFKKGFTSKSGNSRGRGLYKLKKMIAKYNGEINFYYDTEAHKIVVQINHK